MSVDETTWKVEMTLREIRGWADAKSGGKSGDYFDIWRLCDEALRALHQKK